MAFSLGLDEQDAKREFTNTEDIMFVENEEGVSEAWVPVEITLVTDGFNEAWETGARQWREATAKDQAAFYPVREAWKYYEPVSISGTALPLLFPSSEAILASYNENIDVFVEREVTAKADFYLGKIRERGENPKIRNHLGILYARYGMYDDAQRQFRIAADRDREYIAPMINLGNISYLNKDYENALSWYEKAAAEDPENGIVLAGLARSHYELEQFDQAREDYQRLAEVSPETAEEYAYLGQASETYARASAVRNKGKTLWEDEEALDLD
jgi:tetratricopeptide (TPR) repeat protein